MRLRGRLQNPPVTVRLARSPRLSSVSQHREASKPGVKKAHDAGDAKALNRREEEANMAKGGGADSGAMEQVVCTVGQH